MGIPIPPYPRTDIKDICRLSIKDSGSTLYNYNWKGQPVKKCNRISRMSYQKRKEDYGTKEVLKLAGGMNGNRKTH